MTFIINPLGMEGRNRRLLQEAFISVSATFRPLMGQEAILASELEALGQAQYMLLLSALKDAGMLSGRSRL